MKVHGSPDIRYSDVANFVGSSVAAKSPPKLGPRSKPASRRTVLSDLDPDEAPRSELTLSRVSAGTDAPGGPLGRVEKVRSQLESLRAEQLAERERVKKLDSSLSDAVLLQEKAHQRANRQREQRNVHKQRADSMETHIRRLREELAEAERTAVTSQPASRGTSAKRGTMGHTRPVSHSCSGLRSAGSVMAAGAARRPSVEVTPPVLDGGAPHPFAGGHPQDGSKQGGGEGAASVSAAFDAGADQTLEPGNAALKPGPKLMAEPCQAAPSGDPRAYAGAMRCASEPRLAGRRPSVAHEQEPLGITLKDYFDQSFSELSTSMGRGSYHTAGFSTTADSYLSKRRYAIPADPLEIVRNAIRSELILHAGGTHRAFKRLDLNGSGHISLQAFADGVERVGVRWTEITGMKRPIELFRLFDMNRDGVIDFDELFGHEAYHHDEPERMSTPEFWGTWCRQTRDLGVFEGREPKWEPSSPYKELELRNEAVQTIADVENKKKWMSATIRRLKSRGKSDARCREVVALHLPRGTGPRDREDVQTFSEHEVKVCRKRYIDQIQDPVKNIQKVVCDMKEQRKTLHDYRHKLWTVTMEPHLRQRQEEDMKKTASSLQGLFAKVARNTPRSSVGRRSMSPSREVLRTSQSGSQISGSRHSRLSELEQGESRMSHLRPPASRVSGSRRSPRLQQQSPRPLSTGLQRLAQEFSMEDKEVEDLHASYRRFSSADERLVKEGFDELMQELCPSRDVSKAEVNAWWAQLLATGGQDVSPNAQSDRFGLFVQWYTGSEVRRAELSKKPISPRYEFEY